MSTENTVRTAVGLFVMILISSLIASVIGGVFAMVVALVSPEFVRSLFAALDDVVRYAFAVGMVGGVFMGAAVSCGACFLAVVIKIIRIRLENRQR